MVKVETPAQIPLARCPLKVVVAGGFGSGKSALINLLIQNETLERHVGFQRSPLIRIVGSSSAPICIETDRTGLRAEVTDFQAALRNPNTEIVEQTSPLPMLGNMEIVEYPADEFGEINADHLDIVADADLLIWCTIGSQAWRLSEKTALARLSEAFDGQVMLAVMRADHFRNAEDLNKVRQRLEREVDGIASDIEFVSALRSNGGDRGALEGREKAGVDHIDTVIEALKERALASRPAPLVSEPMSAPPPPSIPVPSIPVPILAAQVQPLLDAFRANPGVHSVGIICVPQSPSATEETFGDVPELAANALAALLDLAGSEAGNFEQIVVTTAASYLVFHDLAQTDGLALVLKYRRKGVVISAELAKVRRTCEDWSSSERPVHGP